jgi:signal peptidase II
MNAKKIFRALLILVVIAGNLGCDQISKNFIRQKISPYAQIGLLGNHLTITNVENTGAFLSLGDSLSRPARSWILMILPLGALAAAFYYALARPALANLQLWGLGSVIGGGIGNIYDRIWYGSVTDFLHLKWGILQTGIFNLADMSIMAGMGLLLAHFIRTGKKISPGPGNFTK